MKFGGTSSRSIAISTQYKLQDLNPTDIAFDLLKRKTTHCPHPQNKQKQKKKTATVWWCQTVSNMMQIPVHSEGTV